MLSAYKVGKTWELKKERIIKNCKVLNLLAHNLFYFLKVTDSSKDWPRNWQALYKLLATEKSKKWHQIFKVEGTCLGCER